MFTVHASNPGIYTPNTLLPNATRHAGPFSSRVAAEQAALAMVSDPRCFERIVIEEDEKGDKR